MNAPIAEFSDYDGLREAINKARDHRKMALRVMNDLIECPEGYFEKIVGPNPVRRMGMQSLGWAFSVLGVKCLLVEDPHAWDKIARHSRYQKRDVAHWQSVMLANSKQYVITARHLRKIQPLGGKARAAKLTKTQRKKIARNAANVRWAKQRGEEKLAATRQRRKAADASAVRSEPAAIPPQSGNAKSPTIA